MKQDDMVSAAYAQGRRNQRESDEALLRKALEALEMSRRFVYADNRPQCDDAIDALRAALAQQDEATGKSFLQVAPVQEPVAWIQPDHLQKARIAPFLCRVEPTQRCADFVPLYTAPPQRKPLTEEEIVDAVREADLDWQAGWTLDERAPNRFVTLARAAIAKATGEQP